MTISTCTRRQLAEDSVTEVQTRGAVRTALTPVADEERQARWLPIDGDDDLLSTVIGHVPNELGAIHGDYIVRVDLLHPTLCARSVSGPLSGPLSGPFEKLLSTRPT